MTHRLAVFDLDGTLVDTAPDLIDTTNVVLGARGFAPAPSALLRPQISFGARRMILQALDDNGAKLSDAEVDTILAEFLEEYASRTSRHSRPFPEILAALPMLAEAGVGLGVCTNKRELLARQLLGELNLLNKFSALSGRDTFDVSKPHPGHLLKTIALTEAAPQNCVFVGDSEVDFETARAAQVPFVGLSYGYSNIAMEDLGPDRLCKPGDDIAAAIFSLLPATV